MVVGKPSKEVLHYAEVQLGARHSPDLFHVQQDTSRAVSLPLASHFDTLQQIAAAAGLSAQATKKLAKARRVLKPMKATIFMRCIGGQAVLSEGGRESFSATVLPRGRPLPENDSRPRQLCHAGNPGSYFGRRCYVCRDCRKRPKAEVERIEREDGICGFLEQSNLSQKNIQRLETLTDADLPGIADLASLVLADRTMTPVRGPCRLPVTYSPTTGRFCHERNHHVDPGSIVAGTEGNARTGGR